MLNRLLRLQPNTGLRYAVSIAFVLGLFAVGFLISNLLNPTLQPLSQSIFADASRPTGGSTVDPPHLLQDFTLTSHTGEPISLSDLRGRAVLMFFGYTHCPDVCPTTLADYRRVKQALGDEADKVAFVFISVDGARDTPDVLAQYLGQFDTDFIGMMGDETTLRRVGAGYGLLFQQETISVEHEHEEGYTHQHGDDLDAENYFVQHTSPSFLIDQDGYLRLVYFYGTEPEVIAEGIRQILP
jgi:protein SCO1/2